MPGSMIGDARKLVFVALLAAASEGVQAQAPDSADYFPLAIGNSWTYATNYGLGYLGLKTFAVTDTALVNDTLYYVASYPTMLHPYREPDGDLVSLLRTDDGLRIWTRLSSQDVLLFDFSLESGATYSFPFDYPQDSTVFIVTVNRGAGFSFRGLTFENIIGFWFDNPDYVDEEKGYGFMRGLGMVSAGGGHGESFILDSAYVNGQIITSIDSESPRYEPPAMAAEAYPNPFSSSVTVEVKSVPNAQAVRAEVFDLLGRSVAVLPDPDCMQDICRFTWDGEGAYNGVYFVRLSGGNRSDTVLLVLRR